MYPHIVHGVRDAGTVRPSLVLELELELDWEESVTELEGSSGDKKKKKWIKQE